MTKIKLFLVQILVITLLMGTIVWADTDGIWHEAEDVRGGIFGSDEQSVTNNFTFINPVYINTTGGRGLYSLSSVDDGIGGVTSATGKSAIYGWANNPASYSGYFEGGKFSVVSGNAGIGTTNPIYKLHVKGFLSGFTYDDITAGTQEVKIAVSSNKAGGTNYIYAGYAGPGASEGALALGTYSNQGLLHISPSGNIGIGTTTPTEKLDINGSVRIRDSSSCERLYTDILGNVLCGAVVGDNDWTEAGGNVYRLSGNVGIGTATPSARLQIDGSNPQISINGNGHSEIILNRASTTFQSILNFKTSGIYDWSILTDNTASPMLRFVSNGIQNRLVISQAGNVGIGTSTPEGRLHLNSPTGIATELIIESSAATAHNGAVVFKAGQGSNVRATGNYYFDIGGGTEWFSGRPYFYSGGTSYTSDMFVINRKVAGSHDVFTSYLDNTLFAINNNGNVGIGTISPTEKLDINGNVRVRGKTSCGKLYTDASGNVLCGTDGLGVASCSECDSSFVNEGQANSISTNMIQDNSIPFTKFNFAKIVDTTTSFPPGTTDYMFDELNWGQHSFYLVSIVPDGASVKLYWENIGERTSLMRYKYGTRVENVYGFTVNARVIVYRIN